ncbi:MAG TPA: Ig-like domain-containing protein, partial [Xanthomonadales bacterium]|nr:Ig-like domain-containing protein [Xanthomonadales bacterium]
MKFARQFFLLTLVACTGLLLSACEPSKAKAPEMPTLQSISIAPGAASVPISSTQPLVVTATYSDGSTLVVTSASSYSSSATVVATVSSSGVVTAVSAGTATITATVSGQSATATITVPQAALVSIALRPTTVTLASGGARQLAVIGT